MGSCGCVGRFVRNNFTFLGMRRRKTMGAKRLTLNSFPYSYYRKNHINKRNAGVTFGMIMNRNIAKCAKSLTSEDIKMEFEKVLVHQSIF